MKTKFYWHIHHGILLEPLTEPIGNRIKFIKENKSKSEIPLRLRLLKPIEGNLPTEVIKALEAYNKALEVYNKAFEYNKAKEAFYEALEACSKTKEAFNKTLEACSKILRKYKKEIEVLHKKECPGCPWNGETIFTRFDEKKQEWY